MRRPAGRLLAVLAAAGALRLQLAALHDFSWDEAFTYFASRLSWRQILLMAKSDRHPPTHYWLMHLIGPWTHSELLLRLPSVAFAVLSCFLVYRIAHLLTLREDASLAAAAIYATFFSFWDLDTQCRMFALALVATLAATWLLARILVGEERRPTLYVGYAAATLLALWSLYLSVFVLAAHLLAGALLGRRDRRLHAALAAVFVGSLPLAALVLTQLHQGNTETFNPALVGFHVATLYPYFLGILSALQAAVHLDPTRPACIAASAVVTLGMGIWHARLLRRMVGNERRRGIFLAVLTAGQLAILLAVAAGTRLFNLRAHYFLLAFPYLAVLTAVGCAGRVGRLVLVALLALNLGLWAEHSLTPYLWDGNMEPLAAVVRTEAAPLDAVLIYLPPAAYSQFVYDYAPEAHCLVEYQGSIVGAEPSSRAYFASGHVPLYIVRSAAALRRDFAGLRRRRSLWLVIQTLSRPGFHEQGAVRGFLERTCDVSESYETTTAYYLYGEESLQLFRLRPRP